MKNHNPPLPKALALEIFRPLFPRKVKAIAAANQRVRKLIDSGEFRGITKIVLPGVAQNFVVDEMKAEFAPETDAGKITWHESEYLQTMRYKGVSVRYSKVDGDILPSWNNTGRSRLLMPNGLLFNDLYGEPGEPESLPELTVGVQWKDGMVATPSAYLVCFFAGDILWSEPVTDSKIEVAPITDLKPEPKTDTRVRSKKPKKSDEGEAVGG